MRISYVRKYFAEIIAAIVTKPSNKLNINAQASGNKPFLIAAKLPLLPLNKEKNAKNEGKNGKYAQALTNFARHVGYIYPKARTRMPDTMKKNTQYIRASLPNALGKLGHPRLSKERVKRQNASSPFQLSTNT